ncbi:MAG: anti-sigma factor [Phycisphaerales bacterium]|nr:anti-sigma factor [Phycisphaerales bacterium]
MSDALNRLEQMVDAYFGEASGMAFDVAHGDEFESIELAAAACDLAMSDALATQMPSDVRSKVLDAMLDLEARRSEETTDALPMSSVPTVVTTRSRFAISGWVAAAALLLIGTATIMLRNTGPMTLPEFQNAYADIETATWSDWDNPELAGVTGTVYWSESAQKGYMTFTGLDVNDPKVEQYQLWIIDERGLSQRISGALFNCDGSQISVPIEPGIEVHDAAAFAVTIEAPGGTWVSDMSRRVVIASLGG